MTAPEIAIVAPNTLTSLGLQNLLEEIIPMATIRVFRSFAELMDDTPDMYAHYFISSQIYFTPTSNRTVSAPPCRLMPPATPMPTSFPPAR